MTNSRKQQVKKLANKLGVAYQGAINLMYQENLKKIRRTVVFDQMPEFAVSCYDFDNIEILMLEAVKNGTPYFKKYIITNYQMLIPLIEMTTEEAKSIIYDLYAGNLQMNHAICPWRRIEADNKLKLGLGLIPSELLGAVCGEIPDWNPQKMKEINFDTVGLRLELEEPLELTKEPAMGGTDHPVSKTRLQERLEDLLKKVDWITVTVERVNIRFENQDGSLWGVDGVNDVMIEAKTTDLIHRGIWTVRRAWQLHHKEVCRFKAPKEISYGIVLAERSNEEIINITMCRKQWCEKEIFDKNGYPTRIVIKPLTSVLSV